MTGWYKQIGVPTDLRFRAWILLWTAVLLAGAAAGVLCLTRGLHVTNMDNRFVFALWIFLDLTIIALGAGAFFTGFLLYVLRRREVKEIINAAVVVGFVCYSGAIVVLMVDVGQPLRAWFTFWHPNVHSMLTEITFCITIYLTVLAFEYLPLIIKNKKLSSYPTLSRLGETVHRAAVGLAALGAFLSFFHQGSLGGLYGVLNGRPFAFREGFAIWPATFFLFILSAVAVGPSFLVLVTKAASRLTRQKLVSPETYDFLAKLSGRLLALYVLAKSLDTILWANDTVKQVGLHPFQFYGESAYGTWILIVEIGVFGAVPALLLLQKRVRERPRLLVLATSMACVGIALNRYVQTIQTLAVPTVPFEGFAVYVPNAIEVLVTLGVLAYGVLLFSLSLRYLPLYSSKDSPHFTPSGRSNM